MNKPPRIISSPFLKRAFPKLPNQFQGSKDGIRIDADSVQIAQDAVRELRTVFQDLKKKYPDLAIATAPARGGNKAIIWFKGSGDALQQVHNALTC